MTPDTDSEVKRRWDRLQEEIKKPGSSPLPDQKHLFEIEEQAIELAYKDIIRRRREGSLTDQSRIDQAVAIIKQLSAIHEMKVDIRWGEYAPNPAKFSWQWILAIRPKENPESQLSRWNRFVEN